MGAKRNLSLEAKPDSHAAVSESPEPNSTSTARKRLKVAQQSLTNQGDAVASPDTGSQASQPSQDLASPQQAVKESSPKPSPLARIQAAIRIQRAQLLARDQRVFSRVEDLRSYISGNDFKPDDPRVEVIVEGTFLYATEHTFSGKKVLRLHIADVEPVDSLSDLIATRESYGNKNTALAIDAEFFTVACFGEDLRSPGIPVEGTRIRVTTMKELRLFNGVCCSAVAKLSGIQEQ